MRILQVRFKNLNSLAGSWTIDFTHPAFAGDGIFAITGPTGAGKTTILDAICLALYGRTPRLPKISRASNEILSRQTGECSAEVTFETPTGRFRCTWSQRRARRTPDGELQPPRHEIVHAETGKVLETRMKGVADQIESATGMDFNRFTRSMLLAQGDFASFLEADPGTRAPILEQITGTEIYSRISIRVHERRTTERAALDRLQAELDGMHPLAPEEEAHVRLDLRLKTEQEETLHRRLAEAQRAIAWMEGMHRLEEELQALSARKADLQTRTAAFTPKRRKLEAALRALELDGDFAALTAFREAERRDREALAQSRKQHPRCAEQIRLAEAAAQTAAGALAALSDEKKELLPRIRSARELDLRIAEKEEPIRAVAEDITGRTASLDRLQAKQKQDSARLQDSRLRREALEQERARTSADEALVENLEGIRERMDALSALNAQRKSRAEEMERYTARLEKAEQEHAGKASALGRTQETLQRHQTELDGAQQKLQTLLGNRSLPEWRKHQSTLADHSRLLEEAIAAAAASRTAMRSLEEGHARHQALRAHALALQTELDRRIDNREALQQQAGLWETQLALLERIESLEDARHRLEDGKPCPLCGATQHPFASEPVPATHDARERWTAIRATMKSAEEDISRLQIQLAETAKDIEQAAADSETLAAQIAEAERRVHAACSVLPEGCRPNTAPHQFERLADQQFALIVHAIDHASRIVEEAEALEQECGGLREALNRAKDAGAEARLLEETARLELDVLQHQRAKLQDEAQAGAAAQDNAFTRLCRELTALGMDIPSLDAMGTVLADLTRRRKTWWSNQKALRELETSISELEIRMAHQSDQILKTRAELEAGKQRLDGLRREREDRVGTRRALFGDRDPDEEEARLTAALTAAQIREQAAQQCLSEASGATARLQAGIGELEKSIGERSAKLEFSEKSFQARWIKAGFADEAEYRNAALPEEERRELSHASGKLSEEEIEIGTMEREKAALLASEQQLRITDQPLEAIREAARSLITTQKELQQEMGRLHQKLQDNDGVTQMQEERMDALRKQQRECERWDNLHALIGSADGQKYRNFAQGITFEIMIGHANRQLQRMTDRYVLVHDDTQPLELNVLDAYQAGEIRSTKNLSGGESFIVSLALALGLSQMAGKNVRIDSLFLDEGFGSLDEEALDTALETLAGLQRDGKLIGVISHVSALKERIAARILVTTGSGGRSRLSGPGCSEISEG